MNDIIVKLDEILEQLRTSDVVPEKKRLYELANKYWGFSDEDIKIIELSKTIMNQGNKNNDGKTLEFIVDIIVLMKRGGEKRLLDYLDGKSD